jgi:hypothetical protein
VFLVLVLFACDKGEVAERCWRRRGVKDRDEVDTAAWLPNTNARYTVGFSYSAASHLVALAVPGQTNADSRLQRRVT